MLIFCSKFIISIQQNRSYFRGKFEAFCRMCDGYTRLIPLTFLLGFYVSNGKFATQRIGSWAIMVHNPIRWISSSHEGKLLSFTVVSRWWSQFQNLNWYLMILWNQSYSNFRPEDILSILCTFMTANDEKTQKRRHAIARYLNLSMALVL